MERKYLHTQLSKRVLVWQPRAWLSLSHQSEVTCAIRRGLAAQLVFGFALTELVGWGSL